MGSGGAPVDGRNGTAGGLELVGAVLLVEQLVGLCDEVLHVRSRPEPVRYAAVCGALASTIPKVRSKDRCGDVPDQELAELDEVAVLLVLDWVRRAVPPPATPIALAYRA